MNRTIFLLLTAACSLVVSSAQSGRLVIDWDKLAPNAKETVNVNLEGPMLEMASKFLSKEKGDEAKVRKIIEGLKGIYVKTMEFDKAGQYSESDLSAIRTQLKAPEWTSMVTVREKGGDNVDIFYKGSANQIRGLVIISAEPKELTVVNIDGLIDLAMLNDLGGKFGIPKMEMGPKPRPAPKPAAKDDEE